MILASKKQEQRAARHEYRMDQYRHLTHQEATSRHCYAHDVENGNEYKAKL